MLHRLYAALLRLYAMPLRLYAALLRLYAMPPRLYAMLRRLYAELPRLYRERPGAMSGFTLFCFIFTNYRYFCTQMGFYDYTIDVV
jgi:hypothetical protein